MPMDQLKLFEQPNDYTQHKKYINGVFKSKDDLINDLRNNGKQNIYRVLSFGGGTQSAHLLEDHLQGKIHYDFIVFADTGAEPQFIHEQVAWWQDRQKQFNNRTPFIIATHNSMEGGLEEMLHRYILTDYQRFQMPVYCNTINEDGQEVKAGIMPRQCTVDFKIVPVKQAVRRAVLGRLNRTTKQKMPDNIAFVIDIGFSYDEINRISLQQSPQFKYIYLAYPLVEQGLTTQDSIKFLQDNQLPEKRSRCYFCPFNCDKPEIGMDWAEIIHEEPLSFLKACYFDTMLRNVVLNGGKRIKSIPYFHYSRRPLAEVYAAEYSYYFRQYESELSKWIGEWLDKIEQKYGQLIPV
ncbi:hypothetical protein AN965_16905 [Alkalicoccobacillus plakortidis]|uniref:Phosphoadenosine phosphosulphate reductase domain-containing protein n=2 Tax=Bacillaceae TaxID=186817 RepID=A0A9D5I018_9BACI|nr:hypothetical protein AN965_16905 [Alkalicoccobacillus plakortidis]